jgi:hypothetical protein
MYSPDGFASLTCAIQGQCWFLGYQQPFIELMRLINGNIYLFFGLQALLWFALIGLIYFLAKELNSKHLFLTPFITMFGGTFFIYNFIGNLENDSIGIILILISLIYLIRYNKTNDVNNLIISATSILLSLQYWLWIGHLLNPPRIISRIVEEMFWTHWASWIFLFFGILFILILSIKHKKRFLTILTLTIMFYPKLFIFILPNLMVIIDKFVDFIYTKNNNKFLLTIIVLGLLIGQTTIVIINTSQSWNREIEDEECVLVNDEYFLRATKGLNYSYNQLSIKELDKCKQNKSR